MELVGILVVLRHRWVLVGVGALAALAIGVVATHRVSTTAPYLESRTTDSGIARAEVLIDTPRPLLAASLTEGDDTIADRAALLGSLLARDDLRAEIARDAGVKADELTVDNPYLHAPVATPLSRTAIEVGAPSEPNVLTVSPQDPQLPIVSIAAETADPAGAERLANSAIAVLGSLADGPAATGQRPVRLERLGPVETGRAVSGPGRAMGLVAAAALFALWCAAVVLGDRIARRSHPGAPPAAGNGTLSRRGASSSSPAAASSSRP